MHIKTCVFKPRESARDAGWSAPLPVEMDSPRTLLIVFGASHYLIGAGELTRTLAQFPQSQVMGCSTAGEIIGTTVLDDSLVLAVLQFETTELRSAQIAIAENGDSLAVGRSIGLSLSAPDLRAIFLLSDGLNVNGSELVEGINSQISDEVVVTGGLAGDGERFAQTWVLHEGRPQSHYVTAVGFYGDALRIGHGSKGGWEIFGPERRVTRARGNVLYELDGRPALALYKEYLGSLASELPASALRFPLALRDNRDADKQLVRTVLAVDEAEESMTFAGDIPLGWEARLMRANLDNLIDGAEAAATMTRLDADTGGRPQLAIAISCVGRRMVLGARSEDETEATLQRLSPGTQQIGYYSYGEISPWASGYCDLHNQTMTLTTLSEA